MLRLAVSNVRNAFRISDTGAMFALILGLVFGPIIALDIWAMTHAEPPAITAPR